MTSIEAGKVLDRLAERHRRRLRLAGVGATLASAVLAGPALGRWLDASVAWQGVTGLLVLGAGLAALISRHRLRPIDARAVARHLDRTTPSLESSAELLLAPEADVPLLSRLQRARVTATFAGLDTARQLPRNEARTLWGVTVVSLGLALPLLRSASPSAVSSPRTAPAAVRTRAADPAPWLTASTVEIEPPGYTRRARRRSHALDLDVEEGSVVTWRVTPNRPVEAARLSATGGIALPLENRAGTWTLRLSSADRSMVYRLELLDGDSVRFATPDHRLTVRRDAPPVLAIVRPDARTTVPHTGPMQVPVEVVARDDYGLGAVELAATITTGRGEGVKFRQVTLPFPTRRAQGDALLLSRTLDLRALGLGPGDDLYFHVEASDRRPGRPNRTRSETVFLTVPDTGAAAVAEFSGLALTLPPDYFRSQRQIIIDTERLLAEARGLPDSVFRDRANGIGIDQGLLRFRYGEFLGDEFGSDPAAPASGREAHAIPETGEEEAEDPAAEFTHDHDVEENATLLGASVKTKLKAAVAEMWQAELYLRTARPRDALPFEYRALTLLKEVQQDARAYVKRVGFEPPPLEPDRKRLSGDLSKIYPPVRADETTEPVRLPAIRAALRALQEPARTTADTLPTLLEAAGRELAALAVDDPKLLPLLRDVRTLLDAATAGRDCPGCRPRAERALRMVLPEPARIPTGGVSSGGLLGRVYRGELRQGGSR